MVQGAQQRDPTEWLNLPKLQWNLLVPTPVDQVTKTGLWDPAALGCPIPAPTSDPTLPTAEMPAHLAAQFQISTDTVRSSLCSDFTTLSPVAWSMPETLYVPEIFIQMEMINKSSNLLIEVGICSVRCRMLESL